MSSISDCVEDSGVGNRIVTDTVHGEGFVEDARGGGGEVKLLEFVFAREGNVSDVTGSPRFAGDAFAKVIDDDVMEAGAARRIAELVAILAENAIKDFDDIEDADFEAGFFQHLAGDALLKGFAEFERATGNGPLAAERFSAASNEEYSIVFDDDAADADDRSFRIFAGHERTESPQGLKLRPPKPDYNR